jgi:hypothetical protein
MYVCSAFGCDFIIAFTVSGIVAWFFKEPLDKILSRIIADDISKAWSKYLLFAIYVTGISSGVRVWELEKYIIGNTTLTGQRWILEVYGAVIGTLKGIALLLLVFFIFSLIAFVIVRASEIKRQKPDQKQ